MSYPKYLSQKSLEKRYRDAGISEHKIQFLKDFCLSCMNLYGAVHADELWEVYKELSEKAAIPKIQRKELYTALGIFRREDLPYYVFEADEVYCDEPRKDQHRLLASKQLVRRGYGKFTTIYQLVERALEKPFFVPADLLTYKDPAPDTYEQELIAWLSEIPCTQTEFETSWGKTFPCAYTGKKLGEFSFISRDDEFELRYERGEVEGYKGNAKYAAELETELNSTTAAERLVHEYTWECQIGVIGPSESIKYFMNDLNEMGVLLSEEQMKRLMRGLTDCNNHLHLWCNHGWTPIEMAKRTYTPGMAAPRVQFGPGMEKAFADGSLDREEIVRKLKEMGIDVI
ncbi:MAG: hypothetical protein U0L49_00145 [Eubacterium sp.]|nr:hypothetical protein [Eubacterium sp.]